MQPNIIKNRLCSVQIMDANIVFQVAKALPREEQLVLLEKLKAECLIKLRKKTKQNFTEHDAIQFLLKTVFRSKKCN